MISELALISLGPDPKQLITLECTCSITIVRKSDSRVLLFLVDSLRRNLPKTEKNRIRKTMSKLIFFWKIFLKRPDLLFSRKKSFYELQFYADGEEHEHKLKHPHIWLSPELSGIGFPLILDKHDHSLSALRDASIQAYIIPKKYILPEKHASTNEVSLNPNYLLPSMAPRQALIDEWGQTSFFSLKNAKVVHGMFTVELDTRIYYRPNLSFARDLNAEGNRIYLRDFQTTKSYAGTAVLVSTTRNLYHFVAEALRTVVFCVETGRNFDHIVVRSDTPVNFLEMLNVIAPKANVILQETTGVIEFDNLIICQYESTFADQGMMTKKEMKCTFLDLDEFRVIMFCREIFKPRDHTRDPVVSISIREKSQSRGFLNTSIATSIFKLFGFETLNFSNISLGQIQSQMSNTRYLVCESGAGIMNFIFLRQDATIIEVAYANGDSWERFLSHFDFSYEIIQVSKLQYWVIGKFLDVYWFPVFRIMFRLLQKSAIIPILRLGR